MLKQLVMVLSLVTLFGALMLAQENSGTGNKDKQECMKDSKSCCGNHVYPFFVDRAGSFMYHPHFLPNEASQVDKGMYGPIIVEPQQKSHTKEYTMMLGGWIVK